MGQGQATTWKTSLGGTPTPPERRKHFSWYFSFCFPGYYSLKESLFVIPQVAFQISSASSLGVNEKSSKSSTSGGHSLAALASRSTGMFKSRSDCEKAMVAKREWKLTAWEWIVWMGMTHRLFFRFASKKRWLISEKMRIVLGSISLLTYQKYKIVFIHEKSVYEMYSVGVNSSECLKQTICTRFPIKQFT